eukprot:2504600-Prymnesium_polylepis.1
METRRLQWSFRPPRQAPPPAHPLITRFAPRHKARVPHRVEYTAWRITPRRRVGCRATAL